MATTPHQDSPVTVDERYEAASGTSDLTIGGGMIPKDHRVGPGDVVAASGLVGGRLKPNGSGGYVLLPPNPTSIGMALLRLHSEWAAAAKPKRINGAQMRSLVASLKASDEAERANCERENGELARLEALLEARLSEAQEDEEQEDEARADECFDLMAAIMKQKKLYESSALPRRPAVKRSAEDRAQAEADRWYANELRILATRLKSRAAVLEELTMWGAVKGVPAEAIAAGLAHWLSPACQRCDGLGLLYRENAAVRPCGCNHGETPTTDQVDYVVNHIKQCLGMARRSLKQRLRRG